MTRDITWKTGQRIVAGFEGFTVPEALKRLIRTCKVGNIILFRRNVESATQLYQLCSELQELVMAETGLPALIAIDQEGGAVSRLPQECASSPCAMAVASTGDVENAYQSGLLTGRTLNALGINFDLAPVMDTNSNPGNPVIGVRSFGDQPETVAHYGCAVIR
ncbi:MAG: glycoside hydrolase family 3 N-terminal domain-containing protein, partial [Clostridia bacterium]|nr:glycoside hydrolase family 3 N-terminal domain-containing protein [Clostridia bacterium]